MYSLEDRMKAVELYIGSGCDEVVVLQTLGYPSPNALRQWYREYEQTGTLHHKVKRKIQYTEGQIIAAVAYYDKHAGSLIGTSRALGYPDRNTLSLWVRAAHPNEGTVPVKHCKSGRKLVRCSLEQKQAAVEAWMNGTPDYKIAAQYGVSKATVYAWKRQLLGKAPVRMKKKDDSFLVEGLPSGKKELESEIKSLQAEIHDLKMERDVLEKAAEIVKKGRGINLEKLTNAQKADVIGALSGEYRLCELLNSLKMAKSSYFYQRSAALRPDKYEDLRSDVRSAFYENSQCFGHRRVHAVLRKSGRTVSEKLIRRIMREERLMVHCARRRRYNSYMGEISPAVANVVSRDFHADAPNRKWLTDLTEFALPSGKVYLSPVIDCLTESLLTGPSVPVLMQSLPTR